MRKIIVNAFISLDGVMQAPGGPQEDPSGGFKLGGWSALCWDEIMGQTMEQIRDRPYDLLLGRRTYEIFAAHWPYQKEEPISEVFDRITKYVVATKPVDLSWQNSVLISGDVVAAIKELKSQPGPDLFVDGSSVLLQTLLAENLVDELHTWTFPVTLGQGKKLFDGGTPSGHWKLINSVVATTGVIIASLVPDGPVQTGTFEMGEISEREVTRREKFRQTGEL
ncbi:dihydrofolate reductase family protein [Chitinophaga horti]|uniref:Dihydrofolate reductase family protein n=1 Tax=Chitinophaga horti TaxID=2920382 RepID=A0ABY6J463_9BACT|nr:dihydrofolate reductase family protein [Chitinophaga horti]UYQ93116.1 dihydrofolate reductase family protein [Chitinophaga horti]